MKENKFIISVYLVLVAIVILALVTLVTSGTDILYYLPFGLFYRTLFAFGLLVLSILIFIKANKLFYKFNDKRMAIIAGGFLSGAIFLLIDSILSVEYILGVDLLRDSEIFYYMFGKTVWAFSLFIAVFFSGNNLKKKHADFSRTVYRLYVLYAVLIILIDVLVSPNMLDLLYKILPNITLFSVIEEAFYLLALLLYLDLRVVSGQKIYSKFIFGLFILGVLPLFVIPEYSTTFYVLVSPLINIIGFIFLYFGLEDIEKLPPYLSFRQKLSAYLSLFLIISYIVFIPVSSIFFNVVFPPFSSYLFLTYFIIATVLQYHVAVKFTDPVQNIIKGVERYKPNVKPDKLEVFSRDEIGMLTEKINYIFDVVWAYTQQLLNTQMKIIELNKKEKLLREIITTSRETLYLKEIKRHVVKAIGESFNANRVLFVDYDEEKKSFLPATSEAEYLNPINQQSFVGYDWALEEIAPFVNPLKNKKEVNFSNIDDYLKENNLEGSRIEELFKIASISSSYNTPVTYGRKLLGYFCIDFNKKDHVLNDDDLKFLYTIASQAGIAVHQARLFEKMKKLASREILIRKIIATVRASIDINKIKKTVVDELGTAIDADIVIFYSYDNENKRFSKIDEYSIYADSENDKNLIGFDLEEFGWGSFFREQRSEVVYEDVDKYFEENNLKNTQAYNFIKKYNLRSNITIPIIYSNILFGVLSVIYTESQADITSDNIELVRTIANQSAIALYQNYLYTKEKKNLEREKLLKNIIQIIRGSLDVNEVKYNIVKEIGSYFDADRVVIRLFDEKDHKFVVLDKYSEYRKSLEISSLIGINVPECLNEFLLLESTKNIFVFYENINDLISNLDVKDACILDYLKKTNVLSIAGSFIYLTYKGKLIGFLAVHWTREVHKFHNDEVEFLKLISEQLGTAIYQSKLYEDLQMSLKRQTLVRRILEITRTTESVKTLKDEVIKEVGSFYKADRCFFRDFDKQTKQFLHPEHEFLLSPEVLSIKKTPVDTEGLNYFLTRAVKGQSTFIIRDTEEYLRENDLVGSPVERYLKGIQIKSDYPFPIWDREDQVTYLVLHYTEHPVSLLDEDVEALESIANQVGIAINQFLAYEKEKKTAEREVLLREMIEAVRSSLNIQDIYQNICQKLLKILNIERVHIIQFPNVLDYSYWQTEYELTNQKNILKVGEQNLEPRFAAFWGEKLLGKQERIQLDNIQESDYPDFFKKFYEKRGVKSIAGVPIRQENNLWGVIALATHSYYKHWTEEELNLAESAASQLLVAVNHSELLDKSRKQAGREKLLRETITAMRASLNLNEILDNICSKAATLLNAGRATVTEFFNKKDLSKFIIHSEFRAKESIKPFASAPNSANVAKEWAQALLVDYGLLALDSIAESNMPQFFKNHYVAIGVKSIIGVPIMRGDEKWGTFVLSDTENERHWTEEDIAFLRVIADQLFTAIKQAELYQSAKRLAEREELIRKILEVTRSTLDSEKFRELTVSEVGKAFNADRCFFRILDKKINESSPATGEYLKNDSIKSISTLEVDQVALSFLANHILDHGDLQIKNYKDFIETYAKNNEHLEKYFENADIKSDYAVSILETDEEQVFLVLHYCEKAVELDNEDIEMLNIIAEQSQIALQQVRFYNDLKQREEKERLIRELVSGIRLSQSLDEIKKYILSRLSDIFNADYALFVEPIDVLYKEIKNIGLQNGEYFVLDTKDFPYSLISTLLNQEQARSLFVQENVDKFYVDDASEQFFKSKNIKSFLSAPLIKSEGGDTDILGLVVLANFYEKKWSSYEISFIQSILNAISSELIEIMHLKEIEELRNTFIVTLAHDLQVPLIGERNALEFLLSRPDSSKLGPLKEFIKETVENNKSLTNILSKLLDIYNYESGSKKLVITRVSANDLLKNVLDQYESTIKSKSIIIDLVLNIGQISLFVDKEEISKALSFIVENAVQYTQNRGYIAIEAFVSENSLAICVSDNGPGIPDSIRESIFKRYETALIVERKIGAGLSLYLAKLIIESHGGSVFYTTEPEKGSTFCVVLPMP